MHRETLDDTPNYRDDQRPTRTAAVLTRHQRDRLRIFDLNETNYRPIRR